MTGLIDGRATPLNIACENGPHEIVAMLLADGRIDLELPECE
jgi:hypothetical protein